MILFPPIAFGVGCAVGVALGDNTPAALGIIGMLAFVALNLLVFLVQWLRGFRQ